MSAGLVSPTQTALLIHRLQDADKLHTPRQMENPLAILQTSEKNKQNREGLIIFFCHLAVSSPSSSANQRTDNRTCHFSSPEMHIASVKNDLLPVFS